MATGVARPRHRGNGEVCCTEEERQQEKAREGQKSPSHGQEKEMETERGRVAQDPQTTSTQLKRQHPREQMGPRKKVKASKLSIDPITLTEGDLHDIGRRCATSPQRPSRTLHEENQIVLGALRAQIQELQVRTPQAGTLSTSLAVGTQHTAEEMLRART
jgi:hypothetical protein